LFYHAPCQEILEGATNIDLVINLKLREEALLSRCLGRRMCSQCGGNFNVASIDIEGENGGARMYLPPLLPPPECESKLITRSDDTEEVVKERLRVYHDLVGSDCMRLPFDSFSLLGIF
jgi:adenylate kinase